MLLAPRPTPKLEDHLLSFVHDCLLPFIAGGRASIRIPRTRHAVVTRDPPYMDSDVMEKILL
jgi:hypothetical protein